MVYHESCPCKHYSYTSLSWQGPIQVQCVCSSQTKGQSNFHIQILIMWWDGGPRVVSGRTSWDKAMKHVSSLRSTDHAVISGQLGCNPQALCFKRNLVFNWCCRDYTAIAGAGLLGQANQWAMGEICVSFKSGTGGFHWQSGLHALHNPWATSTRLYQKFGWSSLLAVYFKAFNLMRTDLLWWPFGQKYGTILTSLLA